MDSLEAIGRGRVNWFMVVPLMAAGLAAGIVAARHALRAAHPLLDLSAFKVASYAVTVSGGVLFRIAISATPFLLPLMFQVLRATSRVSKAEPLNRRALAILLRAGPSFNG